MRFTSKSSGWTASLFMLATLIMLLGTLTVASAGSLSVQTNKNTYNIGDPVSISGTATPNASVYVKIIDPSGVLKVERELQTGSQGAYLAEGIYLLKVADEPGLWKTNVHDPSSNETVEKTFEVVAIWERLGNLENQIASLQNQTQRLEEEVETLKTSVENLLSSLSSMEAALSTTTYIAYGAIAASAAFAVISLAALMEYFRKRGIYRRIVGKTEKAKTRR